MRTIQELNQEELNEITLLIHYANKVRDGYKRDGEPWEEQWKLRQVVKKRILFIMNS